MTDVAPAAPETTPLEGTELATLVAAKLCHDFISPSGAIVSGLDLLNDPTAQDMRDDALGLIAQVAQSELALRELEERLVLVIYRPEAFVKGVLESAS